MDKIEKIKAEIERLRKNLPWGGSAAQLSMECNCKNEAYTEIEKFIDSLPEKPVSSVWHSSNEEPEDKSSCLIHYIVGGEVSYQDIFSVLYNKDTKEFVSEPYPHATGNKVEQKTLEGGVVAEVYKNMRDRFLLSDISEWAYLKDILEKKEEPVSEDLEEASVEWFNSVKYKSDLSETPISAFKEGAKWQLDKLPHWKKSTLQGLPWGLNREYLTCPGDYYIKLSELLKLPKED